MKLGRRITYSLGKFADTISYQTFSNRVQFYYIDVLGVSAGLISAIWFLFGIWNAINDPLMGQLSDRTRTRWGRRIPYLFLGAVPLGLAFFLLWTPPKSSTLVTAIYFFFVLFVFDTLSTLLLMAYNALFPEIVTNTSERARLAAFRESISVLGLLLAFVLGPILSTRLGYPMMGVIIGILAAVGYMVSVYRLKENPSRQGENPLSIGESLRATFANKPFRWFIGAAITREFNFIVLAATVPFWRKYVLNIQGSTQVFGRTMGADILEAILLAVPFLLAIPSMQIWRYLTPRIGARRAWITANLSWLPGLAVIYTAKDFATGLLGTALVAPGLAGFMMLFIVQLSEITDYDARLTGQYREGAYLGIVGLLMRLAFSIQAILFALLLEPSGYVASAAVQPQSAVNAIRFLIGGGPMIACLLGAAFLYFLRIPRLEAESAPAAALASD